VSSLENAVTAAQICPPAMKETLDRQHTPQAVAVTHVAREPNKIIAVRRFSLFKEIDANVGNNQEASSRSMIKFRTILATSGPLLRHILGGEGLSAIRPHGKDTAKHERPPHTPRRRHRLALALRGCGTTRSIRNAIDSFAKSITQISNS
jgi:hypothetical protein